MEGYLPMCGRYPPQRSSDVVLIADSGRISAALIERFGLRGLAVELADSVAVARSKLISLQPAFVLTDLHFHDGDCLQILDVARGSPSRVVIHSQCLDARMAARLVRMGATDVVHKPCDTALLEVIVTGSTEGPISGETCSLHPDKLRRDYIESVLQDCGGNIAGTARVLSMHRRTLQRLLTRHPVA